MTDPENYEEPRPGITEPAYAEDETYCAQAYAEWVRKINDNWPKIDLLATNDEVPF